MVDAFSEDECKVLNFFGGFPSSGIFVLKHVVELHRAPVAGGNHDGNENTAGNHKA